MKLIQLLSCGLLTMAASSMAFAKTEQITLKANVHYGEEAVVLR